MAHCADLLPSYSASSPPPCYSSDPACGEQLIQCTPRIGRRPSGTFKKRSGGTTVILAEQCDDATIPTYPRHGSVSGVVAFEHRESITEVKIKVSLRAFPCCHILFINASMKPVPRSDAPHHPRFRFANRNNGRRHPDAVVEPFHLCILIHMSRVHTLLLHVSRDVRGQGQIPCSTPVVRSRLSRSFWTQCFRKVHP